MCRRQVDPESVRVGAVRSMKQGKAEQGPTEPAQAWTAGSDWDRGHGPAEQAGRRLSTARRLPLPEDQWKEQCVPYGCRRARGHGRRIAGQRCHRRAGNLHRAGDRGDELATACASGAGGVARDDGNPLIAAHDETDGGQHPWARGGR